MVIHFFHGAGDAVAQQFNRDGINRHEGLSLFDEDVAVLVQRRRPAGWQHRGRIELLDDQRALQRCEGEIIPRIDRCVEMLAMQPRLSVMREVDCTLQ